MGRKIIIGDIHGCSKTFIALLKKINYNREDQLVLLGDYIDRGLNSKEVLDEIVRLKDESMRVIALRGNHEQMLLSNYSAETKKGWHDMADKEFLDSFNIPNLAQLPASYIHFIEKLPYYHQEESFIAVHAGINSNYKDPFENTHDLLWMRNWYDNIDREWLEDRIVVHGHSPQTRLEIENQFDNLKELQVLNIDCGVFLSKQQKHGFGYLCTFDFTNNELIFQENIEVENNY